MPNTVFVIPLFYFTEDQRICTKIADLPIPIQSRNQWIRSCFRSRTVSLTHHFHPFIAVHHLYFAGSLLYSDIAIIINLDSPLFSLFGRHQDDTVGTTRTIDSRGGSIFQHLDRFDIRRAQLIQAYHDRNTVHDIQRFVVGLQRTISTYPNTGLFTRFRAGLHDRNTGGTSL